MLFSFFSVLLLSASTAEISQPQESEQPKPSSQPATEPHSDGVPIIVEGKRKNDEPTTGSRVKRRSVFDKETGVIRTSTGTRGLLPGSGMDPAARLVRQTKITSCKSDNPALPRALACDFAKAQTAINNGDFGMAEAYLQRLDEPAQSSPELDYLITIERYRAATLKKDDAKRMMLLDRMAGTGLMPKEQLLSAQRTRFAIAHRLGKLDEAVKTAEDIRKLAPESATNLANLASLLAKQGEQHRATVIIKEAIAIMEATGGIIPESWKSLADSDAG